MSDKAHADEFERLAGMAVLSASKPAAQTRGAGSPLVSNACLDQLHRGTDLPGLWSEVAFWLAPVTKSGPENTL